MRGRLFICAAVVAAFGGVSALANDDERPTEAAPAFNFNSHASDLDWHERFTLGDPDDSAGFDWAGEVRLDEPIEFATGERWGLTLSFDDRDAPLDLESLRAGAFFNITPRMRIGGQLSFSNPEEGLTPGELDAEAPEVKLESAFKF